MAKEYHPNHETYKKHLEELSKGKYDLICWPYLKTHKMLNDDLNSTFDWANMSTTTLSSQTYCTSGDDVAQLLYDLGIAIDMDYDSSSSVAFSVYARDALEDHYGYDDWIEINYKSNYTWSQWRTMIQDEIDAFRPIEYRGSTSANEGHSWVCDGYDITGSTELFHMNWGWGGINSGATINNQNGWYSIPLTASPGGYTFGNDNGMVRYIRPGTDLKNFELFGINPVTYSGNVLSHDVLNDFIDGTNGAYCNPFTVKYYAYKDVVKMIYSLM